MKKIKSIKVNEDNIDDELQKLGFIEKVNMSSDGVSNSQAYCEAVYVRYHVDDIPMEIVDIEQEGNDVLITAKLEGDEEESNCLTLEEWMLFGLKALQLKNKWKFEREAYKVECEEVNEQ